MKLTFVLLLALLITSVKAQIKQSNIYRTWVLSKLTYRDGSPLPDDNLLKYTYLKYTFRKIDRFNASITYIERGTDRSFEINGDWLLLKSPEGTTINTQKILRVDNRLYLLQAGQDGIDDPKSTLFSFVPENVYQDSIQLRSTDIQAVYHGDTVYKASPKIYAEYKGEGFQRVAYKGISDHIEMHNRAVHFVATFIISKIGIADSLHILESVDQEFDKRFAKTFKEAAKDWNPAVLNGKAVNVSMTVDLRYSTSATTIPAYFNGQKGLAAYNNKDYETAEYFYDQAVITEPDDKEYLYRRGMCKLLLGNKTGACEDWNRAKDLGSNTEIDTVLEKYCK